MAAVSDRAAVAAFASVVVVAVVVTTSSSVAAVAFALAVVAGLETSHVLVEFVATGADRFAPGVGLDQPLAESEVFSASCFYNLQQSCCAVETVSGSSREFSGCRWPPRSHGRTPIGQSRSARDRSFASSSAWN